MRNYLLGAAGTYLAAVVALQNATCGTSESTRVVAPTTTHLSSTYVPSLDEIIGETIEETRKAGSCTIVVVKGGARLDLYCDGQKQESFPIDLGFNPRGDKIKQGDGTTPEGRYQIDVVKWESPFYRSLVLDYPNEEDQNEFEQRKESGYLLPEDQIGGGIAIHGLGGIGRNWTLGCVALANKDMNILFEYVKQGKIKEGTTVMIVK